MRLWIVSATLLLLGVLGACDALPEEVSIEAPLASVTFVHDTQESLEALEVPLFSRLSLPNVSKPGYTFDGWFLTPEGGDRFRTTDLVVTHTALHAQFSPREVMPNVTTEEQRIIDMIAGVRDSVVAISNARENLPGSSGSGVIYQLKDGFYYVVTNDHVTRDYETLAITYERNGLQFEIEYDAIEYLGGDPTTDLAVLRFESAVEFPIAQFADYYELVVGQSVYAIGSPLGGAPGSFLYLNSVTTGILSGLSRFFSESAGLGSFEGFVLQHDAAINPGNSGGALFTSQGEFIGINTFKIDTSNTGRNLEGLGFAVPSNTIVRVTRDIEEFGRVRRAFLGVASQVFASSCGQDVGVCIAEVIADSTAQALGLQADDVIIGFKTESMNDYTSTNNFERLREAILSARVGERVSVLYIRGGITYESAYAPVSPHPDDRE